MASRQEGAANDPMRRSWGHPRVPGPSGASEFTRAQFPLTGADARRGGRPIRICFPYREAVQPPRPERPSLKIPDADALRRLLAAAQGTREEVPLTLAAATGLRRGELLGLRWPDLDLEPGRLHVSNALQRHKARDAEGNLVSELVLVEPKTDRARRTIGLPRFAVDALRRHHREQAERRLLLGEAWQGGEYVFDRGDGAPIDPDTFSAAVRRLMRAAGLGTVRLHDLRHAYATMLLTQGVHPKVASEALGHASVAFTLDTYSHVVPGLQDLAAQAIDEALGGLGPLRVEQ